MARLAGAFVPGIPCAAFIGWKVGHCIARFQNSRLPAIVALATILAMVAPFVAIGAYPSFLSLSQLAPPALVYGALAGLVLERWTRRPPMIPVAVARA